MVQRLKGAILDHQVFQERGLCGPREGFPLFREGLEV